MTLKRMDNVGVVVDDLQAAVAFFKELGLELEGKAQVELRQGLHMTKAAFLLGNCSKTTAIKEPLQESGNSGKVKPKS